MKAEYHPATVNEINGAIAYLEGQKEGLSESLMVEIQRAIEGVKNLPKRFPKIKGKYADASSRDIRIPYCSKLLTKTLYEYWLFVIIGKENHMELNGHNKYKHFGTQFRTSML